MLSCKVNLIYRKGYAMFAKIRQWDIAALSKIIGVRKNWLNRLMIFVTTIGNHGIVWFMLAIPMLFFYELRRTGMSIIMAMAVAFLSGEMIIKHLVKRNRPCKSVEKEKMLIRIPIDYSFPSGHSTSSFAVFTVILLTMPQICIPVFILASMIAFSRMYLQVHYPSDVACGIIIGMICGYVSVKYLNYALPLLNELVQYYYPDCVLFQI